jgi:hypothetical protein
MQKAIRSVMTGASVLGAVAVILFASTVPAFAAPARTSARAEESLLKLCAEKDFAARLIVVGTNQPVKQAADVEASAGNCESLDLSSPTGKLVAQWRAILVLDGADAPDISNAVKFTRIGSTTAIDLQNGFVVTATTDIGGTRIGELQDVSVTNVFGNNLKI